MYNEEKKKVFKIGIAMAGAVSAGAYTAGVIDYLLETLERWEEAKAKNRRIAEECGTDDPQYDHSVPMHDVVIEVIGGASAGGMTSAITALSVQEPYRPINDDNPNKENNKLYKAWVDLNDTPDNSTIKQMLQCEDIQRDGYVASLLNSAPIDTIADRAAVKQTSRKLPSYISKQLEIILTITSLRGIPISVNFSDKVVDPGKENKTSQPAHRMHLHKGVAHFRFPGGFAPRHTLPFDPEMEEHRSLMLDCAKATGAFPLGLRSRLIQNTHLTYIRSMVNRMFRFDEAEIASKEGLKLPRISVGDGIDTSRSFDFVAVDGGTINNEPFEEVIKALEDKCIDNTYPFGVILIDPFPNFETPERKEYDPPKGIADIATTLLGAIRSQAMIKENNIVRGLSNDYSLRMVFPKRAEDTYPIMCGSLDGFGGFLSRDFREHDFHLGRKNAQGFLRKYFCVSLEDAPQTGLFDDWLPSDKDPRHKRFFIKGEDTKGYYPIIPDLSMQSFKAGYDQNTSLPLPEKKPMKVEDITNLEPLLRKRFTTVLQAMWPKPEAKDPSKIAPLTPAQRRAEAIMGKQFGWKKRTDKPSMFILFVHWAWNKYVSKVIARRIAHTALKEILTDLDKRGILK